MDYATGSFCSSCSIPPLMDCGIWARVKKDLICAIMTITAGVDLGSLLGILGAFPFESPSYS